VGVAVTTGVGVGIKRTGSVTTFVRSLPVVATLVVGVPPPSG
jgi:hypothetical protein